MKLYAEAPGRHSRQILLDALVLLWMLLWVKVASVVHGLVERLAAPGRALEDAGGRLSDSLGEAARKAGDVPVAGDSLRKPLASAADAAHGLAAAGGAQQVAVNRLALALAVVVALAPILAVLVRYLPDRLRWIRAASAADQLRASSSDLDLFAIRALAHRPLSELARIGPDPAGAYLRQEPGVTAELAELELRAIGLTADR